MGISTANACPGIFVATRQNNPEVVLTSRRPYGQRRLPSLARLFGGREMFAFDVPIREIVSIEPADFLSPGGGSGTRLMRDAGGLGTIHPATG